MKTLSGFKTALGRKKFHDSIVDRGNCVQFFFDVLYSSHVMDLYVSDVLPVLERFGVHGYVIEYGYNNLTSCGSIVLTVPKICFKY